MNKQDKSEIVKILSNLVSINTAYPPAHSDKINSFIYNYLKYSKLNLLLKGPNKNKISLIAKNFSGNAKSIVFNSHIDTVQPNKKDWKTNPYKLTKIGNYLHGLGSVNCKGSAAVHIYLAKKFNQFFPKISEKVTFTFVTDEENLGSEGSFYLRQNQLINPHTLILGAPTNNNLIVEERGVFWTSVYLKGKTSHAGEPDKGINAIEKANKIIFKLQTSYKKYIQRYNCKNQKSTINIGLIKGGHNVNVVPAQAYFQVDRRITKKESIRSSFKEMKKIIQKEDKTAKVVFNTGTNSFASNKKNQYLQNLYHSYLDVKGKKPKFLSCIGVSDGRYFANDNINIINIGPGDGDQGHRSNEKMKINELYDYFKILFKFFQNINKNV
ncbi:K01439 dapE; succinyl-diaminopimelate desuccinylase [Candidatus Pelagibacterales bacterium]|jgi:acetylornithine deacetylase/succinyl-diaminopimelate desuccinylase family protein